MYMCAQAGGANAAILDRVFIDYFGSMTPLSQVARVAASGSQQLVLIDCLIVVYVDRTSVCSGGLCFSTVLLGCMYY